jgi:hypothetical protein
MKNKFRALLLIASLGLASAPSARATAGDFTINFAAGILTASNSTPLANGSLVILLANGLDGSFDAPSASAFVTDDDVPLGSFVTNSVDFGGPGGLIANPSPSLSASLTVGQLIMVRWFPNLTLSSPNPGAGASYGEYSYTSGNTNSSLVDWTIPASGVISPVLATAAILGSLPNSAGQAAYTISAIPEPSVFALLGGLAALGLAAWRRRAQAAV